MIITQFCPLKLLTLCLCLCEGEIFFRTSLNEHKSNCVMIYCLLWHEIRSEKQKTCHSGGVIDTLFISVKYPSVTVHSQNAGHMDIATELECQKQLVKPLSQMKSIFFFLYLRFVYFGLFYQMHKVNTCVLKKAFKIDLWYTFGNIHHTFLLFQTSAAIKVSIT